ncbi:hypothetical protein [Microbacterium sp. MYb64]|uniref:hypothetical protein n=1 Tax=Microbacterium sp. MYb64 TaxID=1848691 RepID=UPI000CFAE8AA|nr:hypothetical protein [Microbacterium sp. MYb64]PRB01112.1 hypothetical protein CQ044_17570 [Microbacterium sp. MYb64]
MSTLAFEPLSTSFFGCRITISGIAYSSGVLFESPVSSAEQELALQNARSAFGFVQDERPVDLHAAVARRLPPTVDAAVFDECRLVSLSAVWRTRAQSLELSLAYGFDDGVYAIASLRDNTVEEVSLAD